MEAVNGPREPNPEITSTAETQCCLVLELPQGLMMEILSRLSIKSLLKCKCVCKSWLFLISDPHFVKLHLAKSPTSILMQEQIDPSFDRFLEWKESTKLLLAQIVEEGNSRISDVEKTWFVPHTNLPDADFDIVNSCNGLVLLCDMSAGTCPKIIYVCNPILGEYITVDVAYVNINAEQFYVLGFSSLHDQYKVLQISHPDEKFSRTIAEIYTIGTGQWRRIKTGFSSYLDYAGFNAFLHDSIHWVDCDNVNYWCIRAFDFGSEQWCCLPLPSDCLTWNVIPSLIVLEGCLGTASLIHYECEELEIWIMEVYGVKESWTKNFVIGNISIDDNLSIDYQNFYLPFVLLNSGEILMSYSNQYIVCYDPKSKSFQDTTISHGIEHIKATAYSPSFVSLHDVVKK